MKNMEREKFEESWKDAFEEAGIKPSDKVWTNIELEMERAEGGKLKRRILFYQMLAAACVVFAMAIGGVAYYNSFDDQHGDHDHLAQTPAQSPQPEDTQPVANEPEHPAREENIASTPLANRENIVQNDHVETDVVPRRGVQLPGSTVPGNDRVNISEAAVVAAVDDRDLPRELAGGALPELYTYREVTLTFGKSEEPEVDPVVKMLANLERRELEVQTPEDKKKSRESSHENLWTSVGFAAGSFNTVQAPGSSASTTYAAAAIVGPIVENESRASGHAYSMGLNVGTRIAERWVLQGGVNYLTQSSDYTANSVVVDAPGFANSALSTERYKPAASNAVINANEYELRNKLVYSAPYNVNNSMRYLSIPVQAGYLIVDNTLGVQLNAGISTDLFLENTVKGDGDQLAETTVPSGADSPYRAVNLSGLMGTEISYRLGTNYRVSLNPGIRYPLNTIYKSELGVQSSPLTFDVGLRFRYIFQ